MAVETSRFACLLLLAVCSLSLQGCSPLHLLNKLTPTSGFTRMQNVEYGVLQRQKLDIYLPAGAAEAAPVVIFFHGGGWKSGNKNLYLYIGEAISALGFVAVLPDYRLYPEVRFPVFVEDSAAAVAWVQQNIDRYRAIPGKSF
jgi:acetyl esterase/lipase